MKHINHHTPDKLPANCGIGWLLDCKIKDKAIEGTTQNLLDFYSFKYREIQQITSNDFVELCNLGINAGFEKILIFKQGIVLENFVENTKEYWNNEYKDCVIVGSHIETLYIDLLWWAESKPQTVADLFNVAVKDNKKVGIWNENLCEGKDYVYSKENVHSIGNDLWKTRWYAANSEKMDTKIHDKITSSVYSTCGGLSPISNAYIRNLKEDGELICFDIEPLALHMQRYIFENWNGTNWKDFITKYMKENPILGNQFTCDNLLDEMDEYLKELGQPFINWWNTKAKTFDLNFLDIDIMNISFMKEHLEESRDRWSNKMAPIADEKIFVDISNAFNYEINSILYSKNIRLNIELDYLKYFEEHKDKFILKGFDINKINNDKRFPYLPNLFPWQQL
tara:strand:- start:437 stop:1621 length:1185 start_codon:yes stop_codon:yes gene_type:complete